MQTDNGGAGAAFGLTPGARLDDDAASASPQATWRHLTNLIARQPLDLEAHARRILLACRTPNQHRANEALLDLFLALGPRGRALRERLLTQATPWLAPEEHQFLQQHLDSGLSREVSLPMGTVALLDRAVLGQVGLVRRERSADAEQTVLQQAVAMIDDGDLEGARTLLESSLLAQPDATDVQRELLNLYHHARDEGAKAAMRERLLDSHGALPMGWV